MHKLQIRDLVAMLTEPHIDQTRTIEVKFIRGAGADYDHAKIDRVSRCPESQSTGYQIVAYEN